MGVGDFFEKPEILNIAPKLCKAFIDGNYFFYNFQSNLSFYLKDLPSKNNRNSHEYTLLFLEWVSFKFSPCAENVIVVFDSMESRKHSEWHCKKFNTYISINFETITKYVFLQKNIKTILCEYDRNQKIIELCRDHPQSNKYKLNNEDIADIGIFSGNNHFLWMFPSKKECLVLLNIDHQSDQLTQFSILNNRLLLESQDLAIKKNLNKKYVSAKLLNDIMQDSFENSRMKLFMQMIGATIPNDYIKYSLWNQQIFQETCSHFYKISQKTTMKNIALFSFLYFDKYIEKFNNKKGTKFVNLIQNAFKFINFMSSGVFYTFDVTCVKQMVERDDATNTIDLLYNILTEFSSSTTIIKEKNFTSEYKDSVKEKILLRSIFTSYFQENQPTNSEGDYVEKFFYACTCCLFMMVLNLTMKYFNEKSLYGRSAHFYFAKRVWRHVFDARNLKNQSFYLDKYFDFVNEYSKLFSCDKSIGDLLFFKYKNFIFSRPKINF